jgi:hypothetical protein
MVMILQPVRLVTKMGLLPILMGMLLVHLLLGIKMGVIVHQVERLPLVRQRVKIFGVGKLKLLGIKMGISYRKRVIIKTGLLKGLHILIPMVLFSRNILLIITEL